MFIEIRTLLQIKTISMENPEGFTLWVPTLELIKTGIAVGHKATQNQFGIGGLETVVKHALYNYGYIGGWKNQKGEMQYDSVRMFTDLRAAVKWGRKQGQYSIFDLDNGWEIVL